MCSEVVSPNENCDVGLQVEMSILSALRHRLIVNTIVKTELQASLNKAEAEVAKLKADLNSTIADAENIVTTIHNKTKHICIVELETTCESVLFTDCCQASKNYVYFLPYSLTKKVCNGLYIDDINVYIKIQKNDT